MLKKDKHDIACELERILCKKFGLNEQKHSSSIFSADKIDEGGMFFDDMELLLINFGIDSVEFSNKYYKFSKVRMADIPNYDEIFEEFKSLLEQ